MATNKSPASGSTAGILTAFSILFSLATVSSFAIPSIDIGRKKHELFATRTDFFVRDADFADLGCAARILTDGFYGNSNFITYQIERLNNFLSLESTFPRPTSTNNVVHFMAVACRNDGKVLGFAELDGRPTENVETAPRPYMCNLAVDGKFQRRGIARALVQHCEEKAISWGKDTMFLKVRENNDAALNMYKRLGYQVQSINIETPIRGQPAASIVLMSKGLSKGNMQREQENICNG